jgi:hypothetical protein
MKLTNSLSWLVMSLATIPVFAGYPVTVIGNVDPGELIHRATEIAKLAATVQQATEMVRQAETLVEFAGDPKAAVQNIGDLQRITKSLDRIVGPSGGFDALKQASSTIGAAGQVMDATQQAMEQTKRLQRQVEVFGQKRDGNVDLFRSLDAAERLSRTVRSELGKQNEHRRDAAKELADAHKKLKDAKSESEKQAAAAQIAAIQAQDQMVTGQQQALFYEYQIEKDDKERQARVAALAREEQRQAQAKALATAQQAQVSKGQQRQNAMNAKVEGDPFTFDYSQVR